SSVRSSEPTRSTATTTGSRRSACVGPREHDSDRRRDEVAERAARSPHDRAPEVARDAAADDYLVEAARRRDPHGIEQMPLARSDPDAARDAAAPPPPHEPSAFPRRDVDATRARSRRQPRAGTPRLRPRRDPVRRVVDIGAQGAPFADEYGHKGVGAGE